MLIDRTVFRSLQDAAGAEFVTELLTTFLDETPTLLTELRTARVAVDADGFRRAAHSLKSNSQTFGATGLGQAARALELNGLHADARIDLAAIDALALDYGRVAAELKALCNG